MITCAESTDLFEAYLAGELPDARARELEEHAATCATCGPRLEELTRLEALPRELDPPATVRDAALRAVKHRRAVLRVRAVVGAASAIAAVALLAIMTRPGTKHASDAPSPMAAFANDRASPEFAALDVAETELRTALAGAPTDPELTARLAAIRKQRLELQRIVRGESS